MSGFGYSVPVAEGYDEAVVRARLAFRGEGFSILSEMHVGGMLGPEAGGERQYLIMGVWNSSIDQRPVGGDDMQVAVHLPCNLVVQEMGDTAVVAALDPEDVIEGVDTPAGEAIVQSARSALQRVLQTVGGDTP
jgi:uncharacterized protein (DUF302 family)